MAEKFRPQPYRLKWPLTPSQVEGTDEMFAILFKAVKKLNDNITNVSTIVTTSSSITDLGLIAGSVGSINSDNNNGDETDESVWNFGNINGTTNLFTQGSIVFTGPSGNLTQNNANFFWDDTNLSLGIRTAAPTAYLHLGAGTASANTAPLKFTSGTNLTNAEAGAIEWNGTNLFATQTAGPTRKTIAYTTDIPAFPSVVASTFEKAETGTDANVLTYAIGASVDQFLLVQVATDISALTGTSLVVTVAWNDSNNAAQTSTITLTGVSDGTINIPINGRKSTNVVVSTTFVGVSTAYNISAVITRLL